MSQFFVNSISGSGPVPPQIPTTFHTQNGDATTSNNILNVFGFDSTGDTAISGPLSTLFNPNSIQTFGGVVGTGTMNQIDAVLTNQVHATVTTTTSGDSTILTLPLGATGTFSLSGNIMSYDLTNIGSGFFPFVFVARSNGVSATEVGSDFFNVIEEESFTLQNYEISINVVGNTIVFVVSSGGNYTVDWSVTVNFQYLG